jgi:filamentous hemagglutinin family protein
MFASKKKMPSHWLNCINSPKIFKSLLILATVLVGVNYDSKIQAQITPDESLGEESSVVTPDVEVKGQTADRIDGGAIRDRNLFHSFSQFNVGESQSVYFANPDNIDQIFTRVTGDDPSNILGTLGVDGAADLLLLNPNGIIFGENSSLDVEGSFFGTTAESVVFEDDTEFSAVNPQSPLLTVGVPLGLQVGSNPGSIIVRSPLEVPNSQNLSFLGGNLNFEGSGTKVVDGINEPEDIITAPGGRVELGGLSTAGTVTIEENGKLTFPEAIARADVSFNNIAVDVSAGGGGSINVNARNLELFNSELVTGIDSAVEIASGQAGDIIINATDKISLSSSNNSANIIFNVTGDFSTFTDIEEPPIINTQGNAGNIEITTGSLEAQGSFFIGSVTNGAGNAGDVQITASDSINLLAQGIPSENGSGVFSVAAPASTGNGANIDINTPVLSLSKNIIATSTFGAGDAGDITVNATDAISINQASQLQAVTASSGDAGNITLAAPQGDISLDGQGTVVTTLISPPQEINSPGFSGFSFIGTGKGGDISIQGSNFSATNGATVSTETGGEVTAEGLANAGNLKLDIADSTNVSNSAAILTTTVSTGNAGDLTINTQKLAITEGATIDASTFSSGDGGNITINADDILLSGSLEEDVDTRLGAVTEGSGDGGIIDISTNNLAIQGKVSVVNVGISVASGGDGNAGKIFAQVRDSLELNNGGIASLSNRSSGGEISISAGNIRLTGNSDILTFVNSGGSGGNLTLTADSIVAFDDSDIFASSSDGIGGNITLDTDAFFAANFDRASLSANPGFLEANNRVDINASGAVDGFVELPNVNFLPNSLIKLSEETINTDEVVANSCVIPNQQQGGTFIVSGNGGLPLRPSDPAQSAYSTGNIRSLPQQSTDTSNQDNWNPNKPIVEPQGMYRLSNGQLVLSRQCN